MLGCNINMYIMVCLQKQINIFGVNGKNGLRRPSISGYKKFVSTPAIVRGFYLLEDYES